jgi:hypothetical protein
MISLKGVSIRPDYFSAPYGPFSYRLPSIKPAEKGLFLRPPNPFLWSGCTHFSFGLTPVQHNGILLFRKLKLQEAPSGHVRKTALLLLETDTEPGKQAESRLYCFGDLLHTRQLTKGFRVETGLRRFLIECQYRR